MKRRQFRRLCSQLGIDYEIDIETQKANLSIPNVNCDECDLLTKQSHKEYYVVNYGWKKPYWMKRCMDCGKKTALKSTILNYNKR